MEKLKKNFIYVPLILVELYLIITLLLYQFGPLNWHTENEVMFWVLIFAYHFVFIAGYLLAVKKFKLRIPNVEKLNNKRVLNIFLWVVVFICAICFFIEYRNTTFSNSFSITDFIENFIKGLENPALQYYGKSQAALTFVSNKLLTLVAAAFAFIYIGMVPLFIFLWNRLNYFHKFAFYIIVFLRIAIYVSIGTNKGIFDMLFYIGSSLLICFLLNFNKGSLLEFFKQKSLILFCCFLLVFSFCYFTHNISTRVGSVIDYTENIVNKNEHNDNNDNSNHLDNDNNHNDESNSDQDDNTNSNIQDTENNDTSDQNTSFIKRMYYSVTNYVTQGYYGMSLALDEEFTTTYGIGHSAFLRSNFKSIFGIDVDDRTYQHKITELWDEDGQWHSFYSYIANDVSFYGVIVVMFIIGLYYGALSKDAIYNDSIIAKIIITLLVIMFVYMPANNQLLTSMYTFCAFFELTFIWLVSKLFGKKELIHE